MNKNLVHILKNTFASQFDVQFYFLLIIVTLVGKEQQLLCFMKVLDAVLTADGFALTALEVKPNMSPDNADTSSLQVLLCGLI